MSDEETTVAEDEAVDTAEGETPLAGQQAIFPELDREGGTKYVIGGPDSEGEEASREEWAAQQGALPPRDEGDQESEVPNQGPDSDDPEALEAAP